MDKIHDKASKFLKDVCKKKITVGNKTNHDVNSEQNKKANHSLLPNSCCYCHKVFLAPEMLLKHIHRRHSEELILFHKKMLTFLNSESDYNSKSLMSYFEGHFSVLYNELISMKKVIIRNGDFPDSCKENEGSDCSMEKKSEISLNVIEASTSADKPNDNIEKCSGEVGNLKIKIEDVEGKVECLSNKFEEIFKALNNEISLRQEFYKEITEKETTDQKNQERMFFELRSNLLQDFQIMLYSKLQDKDDDFKFQISDLKGAVERLDCLVDLNTKQINSPDYLTAIEQKFEKHIFYILGNSNRTRKNISQSRCSRADNLRNTNHSKSLNGKRGKRRVLKQNQSKNDNVAHQISSTQQDANDCRFTSTESCGNRNEISFLVAEKLAGLNINPRATKISSSEYRDKIELINSHKEQLCKKYQNFEEIYNEINMHAEQMAFSRLKNKKSRKLRFSEPLTLNKNIVCDQKHKDFQNRTYPSQICHNKKFSFSPQENGSKKFIDLSASGDCSWNFSQLKHNSKKQLESSSVEEMEYTNPIAINSDSQGEKNNSNNNSVPNISESINVTKISCSSEEILENSNSDPANFAVTSQKLKLNASNSKINEKDDFDDVSSLESLSSWEDKENLVI